jgi:hypothetical protein
MDRIWDCASASSRFDVIELTVRDICMEGIPLGQILVQLHEKCVASESVSDLNKAMISEKIAQVPVFNA